MWEIKRLEYSLIRYYRLLDGIRLLGINANIISLRNRSIYIESAIARYRYPNKDKTYVQHKELAAISHIFDKYTFKTGNTEKNIY